MARYRYANAAASTLNGAINNAVTSLVVTSAALFPSAGLFTVLIDSELLIVTAVAGTTFTVVRAWESTSAASHSNGAAITLVWTNLSVGALGPQALYAEKSANQTVTSSIVLVNDTHLVFSAGISNAVYRATYLLFYNAATAGDLRVNFTQPSGTRQVAMQGLDVGTTGAAGSLYALATGSADLIVGGAGVGVTLGCVIEARFAIGASNGNVVMQWAQGTSSASGTIVLAGSNVMAWLMA